MLEPNLLHEAVLLGTQKDHFDVQREDHYLKKMQEIAGKMEKISDFLELIHKLTAQNKDRPINFFQNKDHADLLDQVRKICNERAVIIEEGQYVFHPLDLESLAKTLNSQLSNVHIPRQTQLQTMHTHAKLQSTAIFECMANIVKRCNHSAERIIANMRSQ